MGAEGFLFVSCLCRSAPRWKPQGAFLLTKASQFGNSGWEVELTEKIFSGKAYSNLATLPGCPGFPIMESTSPCPFLSWVLKVIVRCYSIRAETGRKGFLLISRRNSRKLLFQSLLFLCFPPVIKNVVVLSLSQLTLLL